MEEHQPLDYSPHHPEIFLRSLVALLVHDRRGCLISLHIVGFHHLCLEHFIKRLEQLHRLLEPAVHSAFSKAFHTKVTILLDLTIVRHVVLILLKQDFCQQAGTGYALVDRQQWHGCNQHSAHAFWRSSGIVLQTPFLTNDLLDIKLAWLVLYDAGHLLANLLIEVRVEIFRCEYYLFQYW